MACCSWIMARPGRSSRLLALWGLLLHRSGPALKALEVQLQLEPELQVFTIAPHGQQDPGPVMPSLPIRLASEGDLTDVRVEWTLAAAHETRERAPLQLVDVFRLEGPGAVWPGDLFQHPDAPGHPHQGTGKDTIRGGSLTLGATVLAAQTQGSATLGSATLGSATRNDLRIRLGEQPDPHRVRERLTLADEVLPDGTQVAGAHLTAWLRAIADQESRLRQNATADDTAHFQALGEPLMNRAGDGGIGIMQRTPRGLERVAGGARILDWLWDWSANVDEGARLFRVEKLRGMAFRYPGEVERCAGFGRAVAATNRQREAAGRDKLRRIRVPPFTAEQLLLDAVRGYNGYAGKDPFGRLLHEFRLRTHATGFGLALELADEGPDPEAAGQRMAWAVWEPVPTADRPAKVGDPDYVARVRSRLGQAGAG